MNNEKQDKFQDIRILTKDQNVSLGRPKETVIAEHFNTRLFRRKTIRSRFSPRGIIPDGRCGFAPATPFPLNSTRYRYHVFRGVEEESRATMRVPKRARAGR